MPDPTAPKPGAETAPDGETGHAGPWLGRRVVVRSLVPGETAPSGRPLLTDAVGVVEVDSADEIVVRRRDDSVCRIARADVLIVKEVPPPPPRRA